MSWAEEEFDMLYWGVACINRSAVLLARPLGVLNAWLWAWEFKTCDVEPWSKTPWLGLRDLAVFVQGMYDAREIGMAGCCV